LPRARRREQTDCFAQFSSYGQKVPRIDAMSKARPNHDLSPLAVRRARPVRLFGADRRASVWLAFLFLSVCCGTPAVNGAARQIILSGNENKIDLTHGAPRWVLTTEPDSISILDFSQFPPAVSHLAGIANSVVGPPSNIAITPDHSLAL